MTDLNADLTVNFKQSGAEMLVGAFKGIREGATSLVSALTGAKDTLNAAGQAGSTLGGSLANISKMVTPVAIGLGVIAAAGIAVFAALSKAASGAMAVYESIDRVQAASGQTARGADVLQKSFQLAGVSTATLEAGLFRLSAQVESGGKTLEQYGIKIRDTSGALKEPGPLMEEVMSKMRGMSDVTERNVMLRELFGRQGQAFAQALSISADAWDDYKKSAEAASVVDSKFMEEARQNKKSMAELSMEWEKITVTVGQFIGIPVMKFWTDVTRVIMQSTGAVNAFGRALQMIWNIASGKPLDYGMAKPEASPEVLASGAADQRAADMQKATGAGAQRLTDAEVKRNEAILKMDAEQHRARLAGELQFNSELAKMRTGSDTASINDRVAANTKEIQAAKDLYDALMAEELKAKPVVDTETQMKFAKERDDAVLKLQQENKKLSLDLERSQVADSKRAMDDELRLVKINASEKSALLTQGKTAELAILKVSNVSKTAEAVEQNRIEERAAKQGLEIKEDALRREEQMLRDMASKYPENFQVQDDVNKRLQDIGRERVDAEVAANSEIINSRTAMVQKMKQLAEEEAGIGDSLAGKAIERLKARGKRRIDQSDIEREAGKMQTEGSDAFGALATGGKVSAKKLQEAYGNRGSFQQLNRLGSTIGGAVGQSVRFGRSAFTGGPEPGMPSNAGMGFGGRPMATDPSASILGVGNAYQKAFSSATAAADAAIKTITEKINSGNSVIAEKLFENFMDRVIRRLEEEASRT